MNYLEPQPTTSGPLKTLAWVLVTLAAALLVFLAWHQIAMAAASRRYGIETPWLGLLLFLIAFCALDVAAAYAAQKRYYGVSIALSGFIVAMLGFVSLIAVAGVGM